MRPLTLHVEQVYSAVSQEGVCMFADSVYFILVLLGGLAGGVHFSYKSDVVT